MEIEFYQIYGSFFFHEYLEKYEYEEDKIANLVYKFLRGQFGFDIWQENFACDCIVIFDNRARISHTYILTFPFLSPTNEHVSTRRSHSSSGKIARSRRLLSPHGISLSTFTSDRYVNDITTSVEIAYFVIQVRKTDSQLNEIRVGINNKENIFTPLAIV